MKTLAAALMFVTSAIYSQCPSFNPQESAICYGTTTAGVSLNIAGSAMHEYSITWSSQAIAAGMQNVSWTSLGFSESIVVAGIPNWTGLLGGTIFLRTLPNNGCTVGGVIGVRVYNPSVTSSALEYCPDPFQNPSATIPIGLSANANRYRILWNGGPTSPPWETLTSSVIYHTVNPWLFPQSMSGTIEVSMFGSCIASAPVQINIRYPSVTLGAVAPICSGTNVAFLSYNSPVGGPTKYSIDWNQSANNAGLQDVVGADLPPSQIPLTGIPAGAGTYTGTLIVQNPNASNFFVAVGCPSGPKTISVTKFANPTVNISGAHAICDSLPITLYSTAGVSYQWIKNNIPMSGKTAISLNVPTASTPNDAYKVTMTDANGCTNTSPPFLVHQSVLGGVIYLSGDICTGAATLSTGPGNGWVWFNGFTSPTVPINIQGTYSVTYTNGDGCEVTPTIGVYAECEGGGGPIWRESEAESDTETAEPSDQYYKLGVYPNPAQDEVRIVLSTPAENDCPVYFYDILGRLNKSVVIEKGLKSKSIGITDMQTGIYLVAISDNGRMRQRKLIVQRD